MLAAVRGAKLSGCDLLLQLLHLHLAKCQPGLAFLGKQGQEGKRKSIVYLYWANCLLHNMCGGGRHCLPCNARHPRLAMLG